MQHKLTKKDIEKMEAEIERRKLIDRPKLIEAVKEARAQGDLSENFEYYAAKREKNKNESRIRYLDRMIRLSEVIEDDADSSQIGIGDSFTVRYLEDGFEDTFVLVTTMTADSLKNYVSIESPIGSAVKGKRKGDKVTVEISKGNSFEIEIVSLEKGAENADIAPF